MFGIKRSIFSLAVTAIVAVALMSPAVSSARPPAGDGSGGKAVAHRAGGRKVPAGNRPDARLYHVSKAQAIEPTVGINKKGHVFYTAASGVQGVDVWKSTNDGESWKLVSPNIGGQKTHRVTLDPYIYLDESTGRLFNIDLTVACSYLSFSDDGGDTWINNPLACGRPINDHQTLFSGPPAIASAPTFPEVVYYCWNDFGTGTSCSKSLDGGISWTVTGTRPFEGVDTSSQEADMCGGFNGHGVVGDDGTVYLPKEYCGQPWLGISHNEGATWERVQVANNTTEFFGSDTSVAVDKKGNLYYAYETQKQDIYLVTSTNGGKTWSKPLMVGSPGVNEVNLPTLDVGEPGKVALAYMGTTNSPYDRCGEDCSGSDYTKTEWHGYITMTTNALSKNPLFYSGTANDLDDPIYRGMCNFDNRCSPILDFIDVEISPDGTPFGAFVDACTAICAAGTATSNASDAIVGRLVGGPRLR